MNRQKITRLTRIMGLEDKKLDQLTLKLKQITQQIDLHQRQIEKTRDKRMAVISQPATRCSIVQLAQFVTFSDSIERQIEQLNEVVKTLTEQRQVVLNEVAAQRTKIKGWTILIEKLKNEDAFAAERASMMEADDRFLNTFATNRKTK